MSTPCPATYFTGLSAEKHFVKVQFNPDSIIIEGKGISETWNSGEYTFERPNNKTFILQFSGKQLTFTRNTIEAHFYKNPLKNNYKFFFKVSRWRYYFAGIFVFLIFCYYASLKISDHFLDQFSLDEQRKAFSFLDETYIQENCMSGDAQSVVDKILTETGHEDYVGRIHFSKSPAVNAFALPSGTIIFTSSFINQMESVEEFIAVLFHEIGHVKQRHHLKRLRNAVGLGVVSMIVFQENTGVRDALSSFLLNQYSSGQEEESDRYARQKLDQNGISRLGAVNFFERNKDKSGLEIFSTHPSSQKRIDFFQADFPENTRKEYFPGMLQLLKSCD